MAALGPELSAVILEHWAGTLLNKVGGEEVFSSVGVCGVLNLAVNTVHTECFFCYTL